MSEYIVINNPSYEYDVLAILKSFYPEKNLKPMTPLNKLWVPGYEDGSVESFARLIVDEDERSARLFIGGKEISINGSIKKAFYQAVSEYAGRTLPWGNLTGIRPTKIAYNLIESGESSEYIRNYYRTEHFVSDEKIALSIDIAKREKAIIDELKGYSIYIGIPFCPSTCLYCSFTSYPIISYKKYVEDYLDCVIKELKWTAESFKGKALDSVYIGGGTPTTLEPAQLLRIINALKDNFDFSSIREFTVEAGRADSITEEKLKTLYDNGVTRISVNPQSFNQSTLDLIGRKATAEDTIRAYELARKTGFDNINMDVILGLPGETESDVQHTADVLCKLSPDSLTVHSLAIKRASSMSKWIEEKGISSIKNTDDTMQIMYKACREMDLKPYYLYRQKDSSGSFENVGYAREGKFGIYNILIMEEVQSIVAIGAGATSKRVSANEKGETIIERCENVKDVKLYMEQLDEMIERKEKLFHTL